jgi:hypothetical protein
MQCLLGYNPAASQWADNPPHRGTWYNLYWAERNKSLAPLSLESFWPAGAVRVRNFRIVLILMRSYLEIYEFYYHFMS